MLSIGDAQGRAIGVTVIQWIQALSGPMADIWMLQMTDLESLGIVA